jgi:histidine ammonia-lyase
MAELVLDGQALAIAEVVDVARAGRAVRLGPRAADRLEQGRRQVVAITHGERAVYGINTGFGSLSSVRIAPEAVEELQLNLVRSHAAGAGEPLPDESVRAMMLLCAASLARGHSGVRREVVATLCGLLNAGIHPLVPSRGSVGASGDLAPLAHVALALLGEGRARVRGVERPAAEALGEAGLAPLGLQAKEGLALLNGTHLMAGSGALLLHDAELLLESAIVAAAMSLEGALGSITPLDARIHQLRPHSGQQAVAARMRALISGSSIPASHRDCPRVQDPYSLRCAPQVLGAVREGLGYVRGVLEVELGAVTDNPLCFPADDVVLSGGNFHGQPLALALDMLAIALTHLAAVAERRVFLLLAAHEPATRLPPFLSPEPGVRSGLMVAQYTAAALVNECQGLAHPASVGNVTTSACMEDYNSMGATAALKARCVLENARRVVAIELLCAAQALEFQRPLRSGAGVEAAHAAIRRRVAPLDQDRPLADDIAAIETLVADGGLFARS